MHNINRKTNLVPFARRVIIVPHSIIYIKEVLEVRVGAETVLRVQSAVGGTVPALLFLLAVGGTVPALLFLLAVVETVPAHRAPFVGASEVLQAAAPVPWRPAAAWTD